MRPSAEKNGWGLLSPVLPGVFRGDCFLQHVDLRQPHVQQVVHEVEALKPLGSKPQVHEQLHRTSKEMILRRTIAGDFSATATSTRLETRLTWFVASGPRGRKKKLTNVKLAMSLRVRA